jgi:hypothetical protein
MNLQEQLRGKIRSVFMEGCGKHPKEESCKDCERMTSIMLNKVMIALSGGDLEEVPLKPIKYQVGEPSQDYWDLIYIEYRGQQDPENEQLPGWSPEEKERWAIVRGPMCFNKQGEWEYEPMPSSRTIPFFARTRFPSAADAFRFLTRTLLREGQI